MASKPMTSCDNTQRFYDYLDETSHAPVFTAETSDKKLVAYYAHVNMDAIEKTFLAAVSMMILLNNSKLFQM